MHCEMRKTMSLRSEFVLFASIFSVVLFLKFHSDKPVRFYSKCLFCTFKQTIKISFTIRNG